MTCGPPNYLPLPTGCAGSPPDPGDPCCGDELSTFPDLTLTIPDGVNAGTFTMTENKTEWVSTILGGGDGMGRLHMACVDGMMTVWRANDPGTTYAATDFECDPVMFTFPGTLVGSTGDITIGL